MRHEFGRRDREAVCESSSEANYELTRREMIARLMLAVAVPDRVGAWAQRSTAVDSLVAAVEQLNGDAKIIFPSAEESTVMALSRSTRLAVGLVRFAGEKIERSYLYDGSSSKIIEPLDPYTLVEATGVSGTGLVVGRLYAPSGRGNAAFAPFIFDSRAGQVTTLPLSDKSRVALATGISDSGELVVGSYAGDPCLWSRRPGEEWHHQILKGPDGHPITSVNVRVSPSGKRVVATGAIAGNRIAVVEWVNSGAQWLPTIRDADRSFGASALNDDGLICGSVPAEHQGGATTRAAALDPLVGFIDLGWLEGHNNSFATAVNSKGAILVSSLSMGPEGETKIFLFERGRQLPIDFSDPEVSNRYGTCMNDAGQIGGYLDLARGKRDAAYAYIWTQRS